MNKTFACLALAIACCVPASAQDGPSPPGPTNAPLMPRRGGYGPGMGFPHHGMWWKDSELVQKIGVTDDQVQKIEKIFQDHRLQLIDLRADLEKQEAILDPLIEADQPDEAQVIGQIDKVAQARANLEKSNAQMLLAIRRVLTVDQWKKLQNQPGATPFHGAPGVRRPLERRPGD